ncbi:hypothetical protein CVT25_000153 [Psilocybe cyanescens]|uniref:Uncharacterized protein n=1 Tax=Psilocybe cyanescens TaxID=93625 RepID=A0A409XW74_PSICY|nr:hypothetical protein CVT25_000153 [Psilocybe cyanescens]
MSHSTARASSVPQSTTTSSQLFNTLSVYELLEILKNAENRYDVEALCPPFIERELEFFNYLSGEIRIIEADIAVKQARVRVHHKAATDSLNTTLKPFAPPLLNENLNSSTIYLAKYESSRRTSQSNRRESESTTKPPPTPSNVFNSRVSNEPSNTCSSNTARRHPHGTTHRC